jgi:hypothetical protein
VRKMSKAAMRAKGLDTTLLGRFHRLFSRSGSA